MEGEGLPQRDGFATPTRRFGFPARLWISNMRGQFGRRRRRLMADYGVPPNPPYVITWLRGFQAQCPCACLGSFQFLFAATA